MHNTIKGTKVKQVKWKQLKDNKDKQKINDQELT